MPFVEDGQSGGQIINRLDAHQLDESSQKRIRPLS